MSTHTITIDQALNADTLNALRADTEEVTMDVLLTSSGYRSRAETLRAGDVLPAGGIVTDVKVGTKYVTVKAAGVPDVRFPVEDNTVLTIRRAVPTDVAEEAMAVRSVLIRLEALQLPDPATLDLGAVLADVRKAAAADVAEALNTYGYERAMDELNQAQQAEATLRINLRLNSVLHGADGGAVFLDVLAGFKAELADDLARKSTRATSRSTSPTSNLSEDIERAAIAEYLTGWGTPLSGLAY